jgi:acyl dehydratase
MNASGYASPATPIWPAGIPVVGQTAARTRQVTAEDIVRFTAISGDHNPIHYDAEVAATTPFGAIVVQGGVITAILNAVVAEDLPGPGTVFLQTDWSFRAPVRPGDTITGEVEVLEVRLDKPITRLSTTVVRDDGTTSVQGTATCYTFALGPRPS